MSPSVAPTATSSDGLALCSRSCFNYRAAWLYLLIACRGSVSGFAFPGRPAHVAGSTSSVHPWQSTSSVAGAAGVRRCRGGVVRSRAATALGARSQKSADRIEAFQEALNPAPSKDMPHLPMHQEPSLQEALTVVGAADERKAEHITCLRVSHLTVVTDFMIVLQGNSRPQNQAICQNIIDQMEEKHQRIAKQQGTPDSGWILLDYGDIIVHIMTPKSREYYDIEGFWSHADEVDISSVTKPNMVPSPLTVAEDEDPFWS